MAAAIAAAFSAAFAAVIAAAIAVAKLLVRFSSARLVWSQHFAACDKISTTDIN